MYAGAKFHTAAHAQQVASQFMPALDFPLIPGVISRHPRVSCCMCILPRGAITHFVQLETDLHAVQLRVLGHEIADGHVLIHTLSHRP